MCSKATAVNEPMQNKAKADTTLQNQPKSITTAVQTLAENMQHAEHNRQTTEAGLCV